MNVKELAERAKGELAAATGLKPLSVTGAFRDEHGWHLRLDMLEMSRVPTATDILGDYEVLLDEGGGLLRFERKKTRLRGQPADGQAGD